MTTDSTVLVHAYSEVRTKESEDEDVTSIVGAHLNPDELKQIQYDIRVIRESSASIHITKSVIQNRNELLKSIIGLADLHFSGRIQEPGMFSSVAFELSLKTLNLLASFRSFLEHQDTYFKHIYGRKSAELSDYKSFVKSLADNNGLYNLFYGLRNFAQHVDMPPLGFSVSANRPEAVSVDVYLIRDQLLMPTAQWSDEMKYFIRNLDKHISIWPIIEQWDYVFWNIARKVEFYRVIPAVESATRVCAIRKQKKIDGTGMIGLWDKPQNRDEDCSLSINIMWIDEIAAEEIIHISEYQGQEYKSQMDDCLNNEDVE